MPFMLARHRVADYGKWKKTFDSHASKRRELGSKGGRIFRNSEDRSEVMVLIEWGDLSKAREFTRWGDPEKIRRESGVIDEPDVYFMDSIDEFQS